MSTIKIDGWKEVENKLAARIFSQINPYSNAEVTSQPYFLETTSAAPGDTLEFMTGTWSGAIEPASYEYRYKLFFPELNDGAGQWQTQGAFIAQPNEAVVRTITLPADTTATRVHIESRAADESGNKYNNGNLRNITQPDSVPGFDPENTEGLFVFVPPIYHVKHWDIARWWGDYDTIKYENCARVDYEQDQFYIDGYTPAMKITIEYVDGELLFSDYQDIRRVLICRDLEAVTRKETEEYIDIDFSPRDGYVTRHNGYPETPPDEPDPPIIYDPWKKGARPVVTSSSLPITAGKVIECLSGSFTGGDPAEDDLYWNRIKLQGRDSPSGSYSENNTSWQFLDLRSEGVPVTFTVFEDLPVGGQIRIVQQHRLKASIDGDAQIQSNNSINYTVDEEVRAIGNAVWQSAGVDFKVGNVIKITPADFSEGRASATLQIFTDEMPVWTKAPQARIVAYDTAEPLFDISYTIKKKGFYRLVCVVTTDNQTIESISTVRRAY